MGPAPGDLLIGALEGDDAAVPASTTSARWC